jgi:hypothetical protein
VDVAHDLPVLHPDLDRVRALAPRHHVVDDERGPRRHVADVDAGVAELREPSPNAICGGTL